MIAATNKDLLKEVEAKEFRLDLYHRLSVIIIHVPSLNERKQMFLNW
ncbi:MAG: sigma 54-interacting transcriptional regulator [Ferruginibacter sp.]